MAAKLNFSYCSPEVGEMLYYRIAYAAATGMLSDPRDHLVDLDESNPLSIFAEQLPPAARPIKIRRAMKALLWGQCSPGLIAPLPIQLTQALAQIGARLGLTPDEQHLLGGLLLLTKEDAFRNLIEDVCCPDANSYFTVLAWVLFGEVKQQGNVKLMLSGKGLLAMLGLREHANRANCWDSLGELIERGMHPFSMLLDGEPEGVEAGLMASMRPLAKSELSEADYAHVADLLALTKTYLHNALNERRTGVNVLLHGRPGSGKTAFAAVLGEALQVQVLQVNWLDDDDEAVLPAKRMGLLVVAQRLLTRRANLLLMDEAEDIFGAPAPWRDATFSKASMNDLLESNVTPTLWITNHVGNMDPAHVRRFDLVIELPDLPFAQRQRLVQAHGPQGLSPHVVDALAGERQASVAVLKRAANVANVVAASGATIDVGHAMVQMVSSTLRAQGHQTDLSHSVEPHLEWIYDPSYLNCGHGLDALIAGMEANNGARLCISGPTGSGKTAFAGYLAERLDRPLLEVRPLDLLANTLSERVQRIAELFSSAGERGVLLLIDDIDAFIQTRSADGPPWGSVITNEMLLQIEKFRGYLIATTSRLDALDTAALRRFEVKLQFDYLTATQVAELVARLARLLAIPVADEAAIGTMTAAIGFATVGDFALLQRRHRCIPFHSIEALVAALREEVALKQNVPRPMGFC